jgi:hypothetical protein
LYPQGPAPTWGVAAATMDEPTSAEAAPALTNTTGLAINAVAAMKTTGLRVIADI